MSGKVPAEIIDAIAQLGSQSNGDVAGLVSAARATAQGPFADDALLAHACEAAAARAAEQGDRGGAWWLACCVAMLRASPLASPQEDAELVAARVLAELPRSPAALGALPQGARWIVAGQPEPPPSGDTIELARRNATTYLERLDAELSGRTSALRARWESAPVDGTRAAIEEALATYATAIASTRAALSRVVDHLAARSGDASLSQRGAAALAELDDAVIPSLRARVDEVRAIVGGASQPAPEPIAERLSFAGAAPPTFQPGSSPSAPTASAPAAPAPAAPAAVAAAVVAAPPQRPQAPSVDDLDLAMRAAFERAWNAPDAANLAAFEQAVRARYELETASMPDPEARRQALDHYVAHAMSQLRGA
ncbi:MAG: hypothetical protein HYV09_27590 [Deltaproteobacteria bacterium]|nr:hypothetical protein [Deltaproteobacteria bacterium]